MIIAVVLIAVVSIALAVRSMKDFETPKEVPQHTGNKKMKGTILIMKDKISHYSSSSSSSS